MVLPIANAKLRLFVHATAVPHGAKVRRRPRSLLPSHREVNQFVWLQRTATGIHKIRTGLTGSAAKLILLNELERMIKIALAALSLPL